MSYPTRSQSVQMIRLGTLPTGTRVISLRSATSSTDTEFEPALETKQRLLSGVNVSQSGPRPTGIVARRWRSGIENTETELSSRLFTHSVLESGAIPMPWENVSGISGFAPAGASGSITFRVTLRVA